MPGISSYYGWEKVRGLSTSRKVSAATVLFRQGTEAQSAILIESGWIKSVREEQNGQERILALFPPGSLLSAETLISGQHHAATAIALVNCQLYLIPSMVFLSWVRSTPQFSWQLHRALSRRVNARDIRLTQFLCLPPRLRLEQLLWQLLCVQNRGQSNPDHRWFEAECKLLIPLQRQELAQMISITPEHLSRLLGIMERDGVIRRDNGWLIVLSPDQLWRAPEVQPSNGPDTIQAEAHELPEIIVA
ncbi:MAG TPA: Crp/Fnr family transcriptional regulator [Blastocatellia bacterium]|nr:Crp/Fnr family transcriptional regulator [Blastocatellia bacterium]